MKNRNQKTIKLSENDLMKLVNKILNEEEQNEGFVDSIKDVYSGVKGAWRGEGYDYFKHLSGLRNLMKDLKQIDKPNHEIMKRLSNLKLKISASKMPQDKKNRLSNNIDLAINHFNQYSNLIDLIEKTASQKLD